MTNTNLIYNKECNIEYFNSEKINYGSHEMYEQNDKAFQNAPHGKFDEQCCICNKGMNTLTGTLVEAALHLLVGLQHQVLHPLGALPAHDVELQG